MSHTPGPWRASKVRDFYAIESELPCINGLRAWFTVGIVHQSDEAEIGMSDGLKGSAEDDARLIAAAPDLLEALIAITDQLERIGDTRPHKDGEFIDAARAAISKALVMANEQRGADRAQGG